jgi:hypothetical protein
MVVANHPEIRWSAGAELVVVVYCGFAVLPVTAGGDIPAWRCCTHDTIFGKEFSVPVSGERVATVGFQLRTASLLLYERQHRPFVRIPSWWVTR